MDSTPLYRKLIALDSTPSAGNEEVALFCGELCRDAGLSVIFVEGQAYGKKQLNLLARPPKSSCTNEVIFQSHLDTVESGPHGNWTKTDFNPFEAYIEGDRIYGLGAADVKLDFIAKLNGLRGLVEKPMKQPFVLVGTFCEELDMEGAHLLMASKAVNARFAVIGEPSELQICYANNGYMALEFHIPFTKDEMDFRKAHGSVEATTQEKVFNGRAAHSSTPHLGDNAILKLVNYLERLPTGLAILNANGGSADNTVPAQAELEVDPSRTFVDGVGPRLLNLVREIQSLEREFLRFENQAFKPSHPTLNIGILETLPDSLRLLVSFRITPQISEATVNGWVSRLVEFASKNAMLGALCRLTPPAMTDLKSPLIANAVAVAGELELSSQPITKAACNESSIYRAHGIDCMVFGSGVSYGNSHTPNEFNYLSQLDKSTVFYHRLAQRLCL